MAHHFAKQLSLISLLLFLSISLCFPNANAGRYFFSKMTRAEKSGDGPNDTAPESGVPKEKNDSTYFPSISQGSGYGLYGRGPEQFSPIATATGTTGNTESITSEKLLSGDARGEFKNRFDNMNDNPYKFSTEFTAGQNRPNYDENSRRYQYGMSDTRFLDNGRFYYDVNSGRYSPVSNSNPTRTNPDEYRTSYGSYRGGDRTVGPYGNVGYGNENENEYNRVFSENGNKEENEGSQDEYIP